jgi:hypothetical protein
MVGPSGRILAVVHELPSAEAFFKESYSVLKQDGRMLFSEPSGHIDPGSFQKSIRLAENADFAVLDRPVIRSQATVLLGKQ